jgi:ABC-type bacteriocin/lantibiotic exporter with double-glycine peptidase domain
MDETTLPPQSYPPETADNTESLLVALEFLAANANVDVDRAHVRRALDEARQDAVFVGPDAHFDELVQAGAALGLTIRTIRRSSTEVIARASTFVPALTFTAGSEKRPVALVGHKRQTAQIVDLRNAEQHEWIGPEKLASHLGTANATEPSLWAFADASEPLAALTHSKRGKTPFARLVALLHLERDDIGVACVYAVGVGITSLAAPIGVQALVNTVAFGGMLQPLVVLSLLVLVGLVFAGALRAMWAWVVERIQQRIFARVVIDLAYRLPRVRMDALREAHGPELVNRFFDVLTVQKGAATLLVDGVSIALQTAVGMVILAVYHPILLAFDVALVLSVGFVLFGLGRGAVDTSIKESKIKYAIASWLEQLTEHAVTFRSTGGNVFGRARAEDLLREWIAARNKHWKVLFRQILGSLVVQALASTALLGVGGWLVIAGKLTLGQLVAAELIVTTVVSGIAKFGKHLESFYDLLAGVDKLGHLVDLPLEPPGGSPLRRKAGGAQVQLVNVSFAHPNDEPVLDKVTLNIEPGARVGIIGSSGSGKSTLVDLLHGLRTPTRGRIDIDGVDLRDIDVTSLREQTAFLRDVEIFEGSVTDNVRLGRRDVHTNDVRAALQAVGLYDEITSLQGGLDNVLSNGGQTLSQSQALRLCVARAIASKPRLVVLDRPLSDFDPITRKTVCNALFDPHAPWTLFVTTHDREVLRRCEDVHVIEEGKLRPLRAADVAA